MFGKVWQKLPDPHRAVRLKVELQLGSDLECDGPAYWLTYRGTKADLIAAGVATSELLAKRSPSERQKRRAANGDRCFLRRGRGEGPVSLDVIATPVTAEQWPGVRDWAASWVAEFRGVDRTTV